MIVLGVLLLAAAAVAAVELVVANDDHQVTLRMWRWSWHFDAFWLAVGGAALLVVVLVALAMLKRGTARARRLRRERRDLAKENRRLAERVDAVQAPAPVTPPPTATPTARPTATPTAPPTATPTAPPTAPPTATPTAPQAADGTAPGAQTTSYAPAGGETVRGEDPTDRPLKR